MPTTDNGMTLNMSVLYTMEGYICPDWSKLLVGVIPTKKSKQRSLYTLSIALCCTNTVHSSWHLKGVRLAQLMKSVSCCVTARGDGAACVTQLQSVCTTGLTKFL